MIVTRLMGGLGNQLFQYAFGLSQAKRLNTDVRVNTNILNNTPEGWTKYNCEVYNFKIEDIIDNSEHGLELIREGQNKEIKNNSLLEGYWQGEKFFENVKEELKQKLKFKNEDKLEKLFLEKINYGFRTITIHARRGDYLVGNHFIDLSTTNYYKNALDLVFNKLKDKDGIIENPKIIIFSNDIEWAKEYFKWINLPMVVQFENNGTIEDLYLMSRCQNIITANSTYSWWAAWLNNNPNKIIIQPKQWLVTKDIDELKLEGSIVL